MSIVNPYIVHGAIDPWTTIALGNSGGSAIHGIDIVHAATGGDVYPEIEDILFTYQQITGDFDISCEVPNVDAAWNIQDAGAGIMCRENLGTDPVYASIRTWWADSQGHWYGTVERVRAVNGGSSGGTETSGRTDEHYLRLTRIGNVFTTYWADIATPTTWNQQSQDTLNNMPSTAYVGFFSSPLDPDFSEIDFEPTFQNITGI